MRTDTLHMIREKKIIAIVRGLVPSSLHKLGEALSAGGIRLIEITFAQDAPETWKDTAAGIAYLSRMFTGKILVGAGTVMSTEQLKMAYDSGAAYIISPHVDTTLIEETRKLELVSLPGALTPTEIVTAAQAGADMVKVFPAGDLGEGYIKAIKAPLRHIPLLAVGGINEKNAAGFLKAGADGLGIGGNLVNKQWIDGGMFEKITEVARGYVSAIAN